MTRSRAKNAQECLSLFMSTLATKQKQQEENEALGLKLDILSMQLDEDYKGCIKEGIISWLGDAATITTTSTTSLHFAILRFFGFSKPKNGKHGLSVFIEKIK